MNLFVLENSLLKITLLDLGAAWLSCIVKFPTEEREILVTTSVKNWQKQTAYFGATIGRYANRIAKGQYVLNGKTFRLAQNNGENHLHGGVIGADKCVWAVESVCSQAVKFRKIFTDGEEGFGGTVNTTVEYRLTENELQVLFEAVSDQDTPLCLTNHAYFNLQGSGNILDHQLTIYADEYLPVHADGIPYLPFKPVANTGFDFRHAKAIRQDLLADADQQCVKGYDHAFKLAKIPAKPTACLAVADLALELETDLPALQLYTGNWLAGQPDRHGGEYQDYAGVALEPECFPDSPNQPELARFGGIAKAGEPYRHTISYRLIF